MMDRRSIFRLLAGAAALPIAAKFPAPVKAAVDKVGAWAQIKAGNITAISISDGGIGYSVPPVVTFTGSYAELQRITRDVAQKSLGWS